MYDQQVAQFNRGGRDRSKKKENPEREVLLPHTLKIDVGEDGKNPTVYRDNTGYKLYSSETVTIKPGEVALVNTAVKIELILNNPDIKMDIQIDSIADIEEKHLYIVNNPGTIDMDYRGEIKIILWNYSNNEVTIEQGEPIGKMGFYRRIKASLVTLKEMNKEMIESTSTLEVIEIESTEQILEGDI